MLRELPHVRQLKDDYFRRCFMDGILELLIWYKEDESIYGFQLCYDRIGNHRAVTWTEERGLSHANIDGGEDNPFANRAPMLRPARNLDAAALLADFNSSSEILPLPEKEFVQQKLAQAISEKQPSKRSAI
jgi:hypothetical protein